jgi:hypothetical protein
MSRPKGRRNSRSKHQVFQRQALQDLGLDREQQKAFLQGKAVIYTFPRKTGPAIAFIQKVGSRLRSGLISLSEEGGGFEALARFRGKSRALAMTFAADQLELFGGAVINQRLEDILIRHGFTRETEPVPEALGGGTMEILTKIFQVKKEQSN